MASSAATASEIIASNDDLLIEILLRLPIKSLIKFKSVSKQWLSLISNPQFSLRRSASSASGLFLKCYRIRIRHRPDQQRRHEFDTIGLNSASSVPPFRSLPTTDEHEPSVVEILQSCNGLLLCNARRASDQARVDYFVYNPTTNHYTTLPLPRLPSLTDVAYGFALAFDPSTSPHYKVVCVMRSHPNRLVMLYSSDAGVWRSSLASFEEDFNTRFDSGGVFWNGSIHWPNTWRRTAPYFNIAEERIGQMPMPPVPNFPAILDCFCESRGHLHFVKHSTCEFQVRELERDYSKWVVKYRVHLSGLNKALPEVIPCFVFGKPIKDYYLCVICVVRCEVEKESYLVMKVPGKIMSYNFASGRFCKICDVEHFQCLINDDTMLLKPFYAHLYIESLACV